jgi:quercetin dioxygenase-like cupin family protein
MHTMFRLKNPAITMLMVASALIGVARAEAPEAIVTPLMTKPLDDYRGKEAMMITVEYPPGPVDPVHRHHAHAFVYVLEGAIVMQVKGGKEVTH